MYKIFFPIITLSLFGSLFIVSFAAHAVPAQVFYIIDGDTFGAGVLIDPDINISVRVRLMNVDTPEINGACDHEIKIARLAKDRLGELIPIGSIVELEKIKDDKYQGRIDAFVIMADGRDVGNVLVKEKLGRKYGGERRKSWCD